MNKVKAKDQYNHKQKKQQIINQFRATKENALPN